MTNIVTEKDFWEALGNVLEVSEVSKVSNIPCSLCPAFIYNGGCVDECKESCKKSLETVYKKIVKSE
jgi:hypothetical protein